MVEGGDSDVTAVDHSNTNGGSGSVCSIVMVVVVGFSNSNSRGW